MPIASTSTVQTGKFPLCSLPCMLKAPQCKIHKSGIAAWMWEIIEAEQVSDESDSHPRPCWRKYSKHRHEVLSDPEDMPYTSTSSESDDTITEIMPDEVSLMSTGLSPLLTQILDC